MDYKYNKNNDKKDYNECKHTNEKYISNSVQKAHSASPIDKTSGTRSLRFSMIARKNLLSI